MWVSTEHGATLGHMVLNQFCVFLYPNTPYFTGHKFLDLFFYLFLMITKLISIFQTFVPQYIIQSLLYTSLVQNMLVCTCNYVLLHQANLTNWNTSISVWTYACLSRRLTCIFAFLKLVERNLRPNVITQNTSTESWWKMITNMYSYFCLVANVWWF